MIKAVLQGYDDRYNRLVDWVTETEGSFNEERLAQVSVADLLILPISDTADHWRQPAAGGGAGTAGRHARHLGSACAHPRALDLSAGGR